MLVARQTTWLEDHYLLAAHNFLLAATQYLEAICIHNLNRWHAIMMDPLIVDVLTVYNIMYRIMCVFTYTYSHNITICQIG